MQAVLAAVGIVAVLALPAAAAETNPRSLVLRQADVPAGFKLDPPNTLLTPNEFESRTSKGRELIKRSGRSTGYRATYIPPEVRCCVGIESSADLFRSPEGARIWLDSFDRDLVRQIGRNRLEGVRARVGIGTEGWVYSLAPKATLIVWRYDRVFARLMAVGVQRDSSFSLARVQQRRIAAALE